MIDFGFNLLLRFDILVLIWRPLPPQRHLYLSTSTDMVSAKLLTFTSN